MLGRPAVALFLALHTAVTWAAFALRVDQFPLTWAPMYSGQGRKMARGAADHAGFSVVFRDKEFVRRHGWEVETRSGSREWIPMERVNVPMRSMWRLYFERTFGGPPPKYSQKNSGHATLDRLIRGMAPGAPFPVPDFQRRLFESLNKTLGRSPDSPEFIVTIRAERSRMVFDETDLGLTERRQETVEVRFREEWREDWR